MHVLSDEPRKMRCQHLQQAHLTRPTYHLYNDAPNPSSDVDWSTFVQSMCRIYQNIVFQRTSSACISNEPTNFLTQIATADSFYHHHHYYYHYNIRLFHFSLTLDPQRRLRPPSTLTLRCLGLSSGLFFSLALVCALCWTLGIRAGDSTSTYGELRRD